MLEDFCGAGPVEDFPGPAINLVDPGVEVVRGLTGSSPYSGLHESLNETLDETLDKSALVFSTLK